MVSLSRALNVLLGLALFIGASFWSYFAFAPMNQPPVKYLSIAILTQTILPGENIIGRTTTDVRRNCPGKSAHFITRLVDGAEVIESRREVDVLPKPIGESINTIFTAPTPKDIKSGVHVFRAMARFDCNGNIFTMELPPASFRVCAVDDQLCKD